MLVVPIDNVYWHPIQDVFPLHAQCPQDGLWIYCHTDQNKAATEDIYINKLFMHIVVEKHTVATDTVFLV